MAVINFKCVADFCTEPSDVWVARLSGQQYSAEEALLRTVLLKVSAGSLCAELPTRLFTKQEEFIQRNMHVFINIHQQGCVLLVALKLHSQFFAPR